MQKEVSRNGFVAHICVGIVIDRASAILLKTGIRWLKDDPWMMILTSNYRKDHAKASQVIELLDKSDSGIIEAVQPSMSLLGAVNREGVTCYLDSLLFAMFATLDSYEIMLHQQFKDEPRKRLALMLRLWVNLLRTGRLVTTDIVRPLLVIHVCSGELIESTDTATTAGTCCMRLERRSGVSPTRSLRSLFFYNGTAGSTNANTPNDNVSQWQRGR